MPKCTGLMPKAVTSGTRIGARMMIADMVSMKVPTRIRNTLIHSRITSGLVDTPDMAAEICWGMVSRVITLASSAEQATTIISAPEMRWVCSKASWSARASSCRYTKRATTSA